jgi:hypothetical protein
MIRLILIILLLTACAPAWDGVCRHEAVYCALTAGEHVPVRIAVGYIVKGDKAIRHAEAQGWIDGKWQTLTTSVAPVTLGCGSKFYAIEYMTPQEFIDENFPLAKR